MCPTRKEGGPMDWREQLKSNLNNDDDGSTTETENDADDEEDDDQFEDADEKEDYCVPNHPGQAQQQRRGSWMDHPLRSCGGKNPCSSKKNETTTTPTFKFAVAASASNGENTDSDDEEDDQFEDPTEESLKEQLDGSKKFVEIAPSLDKHLQPPPPPRPMPPPTAMHQPSFFASSALAKRPAAPISAAAKRRSPPPASETPLAVSSSSANKKKKQKKAITYATPQPSAATPVVPAAGEVPPLAPNGELPPMAAAASGPRPTAKTTTDDDGLDVSQRPGPPKQVLLSWQERYEELQQYKNQFGSANPRLGRATPPRYQQLAQWLSRQRSKFRTQQLAAERIFLLRVLGCTGFDGQPEKKRKNDAVPWNVHFDNLRAFKEQTGEANPTLLHQPKLAKWLAHQRHHYCRGALTSKDKIEALRNLGCTGFEESDLKKNKKCPNVKWNERFAALQKYRDRTGNANPMPRQDATDPEEIQLAKWLADQRLYYKKGDSFKLSPKRIQLLRQIGCHGFEPHLLPAHYQPYRRPSKKQRQQMEEQEEAEEQEAEAEAEAEAESAAEAMDGEMLMI